jgi:hypothetical protein
LDGQFKVVYDLKIKNTARREIYFTNWLGLIYKKGIHMM